MALPVETFFLHQDAEGTLQTQIRQMVAEGILEGRFRPGEKLPSSRKLAEHLGVSRITVTLAFTELLADDYIMARGRSGYFVSENAPEPPRFPAMATEQSTVDWSRAIGQRFTNASIQPKPSNWNSYRYPFIYGQADPHLFDSANWRLCALEALGRKDFDALTTDYYDTDDPKLLDFIARQTLPRRGILAKPDEILLTLGAQNALWLTAQVLLTQRRTAAIEDPCYPSTTPSHQCPTAATMPLARRHELLEKAEKDDLLIVEDDYEFEMSFLKPPNPALKSLDRNGRVIYVGSFSKSLFPGLRLGYLVGPAPFIREARALRTSVLRHPPGHIQRTVTYFLSRGHYDALVRRMSRAFHDRRTTTDQAVKDHGLTVAGRGSFGGSSLWMRAPDHIDTIDLAARLAKKSVLIEPGHNFFGSDAPPKNYYRLAYSSINSPRISEGVATIARTIAEMG